MDYYKVEITITPFEEWLRDVLAAQLAETGFESFTETDTGLEGFIPAGNFSEAGVFAVLQPFEENFSFEVKKELIKSRNWNEEWEKNYFKPLVIAEECLVRAPFHKEYPQCKYEIVIEPNMAFGTGNHETTSLMLKTILKENLAGKKVLDMGCGTGILGILASMKGAAHITAIDIDDWSVKGTQENTVRNNIKNLTVKKGDASLLGNEKYDLIFANIHKNVLLEDIPAYSTSMNPEAKLLMSGFYLNDLEDIKNKARQSGLNFKGHLDKNNWVVGIFVKP
ncbi:50S ribosomal protein L11 methyltransferase [Mariniphaga sediminis]|uniref:50S ribosomal protein L11 methyltransferase n=1 Tax=Mariniphaga sediminis TaxID=1628158 RepID=UPI001558818C|nr:50S ribosomal protein L11 methyltransferase [Mariniphaga sediminis]